MCHQQATITDLSCVQNVEAIASRARNQVFLNAHDSTTAKAKKLRISKMTTNSTKPPLKITPSLSFVPLLPPKAYPPPKPIEPKAPLIDEPVGDQVMPTDDMVKATATKSRSSSTSTMSSTAVNTDGDKIPFLPLVEPGK